MQKECLKIKEKENEYFRVLKSVVKILYKKYEIIFQLCNYDGIYDFLIRYEP